MSRCPVLRATPTNSPSALIKPELEAFVTPPRLVPAGANQGNATWSLSTSVRSAICDAGTTTLFPKLSLEKPAG